MIQGDMNAEKAALKAELARTKPAVADAKVKSETLASQAASLRQKLIDTAARIQGLERQPRIRDIDGGGRRRC